jgi:hypothetical protein
VSEDINTRLSRWSQRKLASRRGEVVAEPPTQSAPAPVREQEPDASEAAAPQGDDTPALPPVEELTADSDYTVFLGKNVPEAVKNAALRKLWRSDPVFANLDGLNNYCEDFNIVDTPITLAQTSYKIGRGLLDQVEELTQIEGAESGEGVQPEGQDATRRDKASSDAVSENAAAGGEAIAASREADGAEPGGGPSGQA